MAHADPRRSAEIQDRSARSDLGRRAAEPRGDRPGSQCLGADHPRRLRSDRDHGPDWQPAGCAAQSGLDGAAFAGLPNGAAERRWGTRR